MMSLNCFSIYPLRCGVLETAGYGYVDRPIEFVIKRCRVSLISALVVDTLVGDAQLARDVYSNIGRR